MWYEKKSKREEFYLVKLYNIYLDFIFKLFFFFIRVYEFFLFSEDDLKKMFNFGYFIGYKNFKIGKYDMKVRW